MPRARVRPGGSIDGPRLALGPRQAARAVLARRGAACGLDGSPSIGDDALGPWADAPDADAAASRRGRWIGVASVHPRSGICVPQVSVVGGPAGHLRRRGVWLTAAWLLLVQASLPAFAARPGAISDRLDGRDLDRAGWRGGARAARRRAGRRSDRNEPVRGRSHSHGGREPGSGDLSRRHHRDRRAQLRGHGARDGGGGSRALAHPGPHHGRDRLGPDRQPARRPGDRVPGIQHPRGDRARRPDRGRAAPGRELRVLDPGGDRAARRCRRGNPWPTRAGAQGDHLRAAPPRDGGILGPPEHG